MLSAWNFPHTLSKLGRHQGEWAWMSKEQVNQKKEGFKHVDKSDLCWYVTELALGYLRRPLFKIANDLDTHCCCVIRTRKHLGHTCQSTCAHRKHNALGS